MRPINKGAIPTDENGLPKTVSIHRDWRKDLIIRIGIFCCYCGMRLNDSPQVEHVIAQFLNPTLVLDWHNLLLACGACNRCKSKKPCPPHTHYLPDVHNTYLAFELYLTVNSSQGGENAAFIKANLNLTKNQIIKANNTIQLCGLNEDTTSYPDRVTDLRWRYRFEAFYSVQLWRKDWDDNEYVNAERFIERLIDTARSKGFFSIWFRRFEDVPAVKKALIEGFPGTALNCFDANNNYNPVWRNQPNEI